MNSDKNINCLVSVLLATCLSAASVGCMVTGLKLPVENLHQIVMACFGCAAVASFCYRFRFGGWVLRLLAIGGIYWFFQDLERFAILLEQARVAANRITKLWNNAYGWHVISLRAQRVCDWPMMIIGGYLAVATSRTVCRQKRAVFPILTAMAPFSCCLVVNDTVPEQPWLYLFLLAVAVLSLTDWLRRKNLHQSLELTAYSAAAVAVVLMALFALCPQETYVNRTGKLQGHLLNMAQELPATMKEWGQELITQDIQTVQPQRENLSNLGDRIERSYTVMEITTEYDGILYLRGQDFDSYDGKAWTATRNRMEDFAAGTDKLTWEEEVHTVTVTTRTVKDVRYVPYYPQTATAFVGGKLENEGNMRTYSFIRRQPVENWEELWRSLDDSVDDGIYFTAELASPAADTMRYRNLPLETQEGAKEILASILTGDERSTAEMAEKIRQYVQNSAEYSLTPDKMPADAEDFALWFLESADSGYCIHFASAATVLLRAAGIEARYVTGYALKTVPGKTVSVPASQAHAWAEYFEPALGVWMVLEPTPPDFMLEEPEISGDPETTEGTQPPAARPTLPEQTKPTLPAETEPDILDDAVRHEDGKGLDILKKLGQLLKNVLMMALATGAVWGQYRLRLELTRKRCSHPDPNTRALHLWRDTGKLCRIRKQEPPENLEMLAQKAKFSQYDLTDGELAEFTAFGKQCRRELRAKPWYMQFVFRIIFALY